MKFLNKRTTFPILMCAFTYTCNVYAIDADRSLPINIESDSATIDDSTGVSTYSGNVVIAQGGSRLEAEEIIVKAQDRKIFSITAEGKPAHFVQQDTQESAKTEGFSNKITFLAADSVLIFDGNANLAQENNSFAGEKIEYDILKKAIKASGDQQSGTRVKIQYYPEAQDSIDTPLAPQETKE